MMQYIFKEWQEKLAEFEKSVQNDLAEIRQCKADIQKMRQETEFEKLKGRYIHDDERIILSAPEIIIGHVDRSGVLYDKAGSTVIVRGSEIGLQGVSDAGKVEMRAPSIRQIAEDPGCDGQEKVVGSLSEVVSQARHIVIHSQTDDGVFTDVPVHPNGTGVHIHADESIEIDASVSYKAHKDRIADMIKELKDCQEKMEKQAAEHKASFSLLVNMMEQLLDHKKLIGEKDKAVRAFYGDMEKLNEQIEQLSLSLSKEVGEYADILSKLAEANRKLKCLDSQNKKLKSEEAFDKETTGASVSVRGEKISLATEDGEGHIRVNPESGVSVHSRSFSVKAFDKDSSTIEDSSIDLSAQKVTIDTSNCKVSKPDKDKGGITTADCPADGSFVVNSKDITMRAMDQEIKDGQKKDKELTRKSTITLQAQNVEVSTAHVQNVDVDKEGKITKAEYPADGEVIINSKKITVGAVDSEFDANEPHQRKEKALAKDGKLKLRSERMQLYASTTEGKATGSVALNAKQVNIMSVDIADKNQSLSEKGKIQATAEKIFLGDSHDEKLGSRKVQGWAEKITLFGSEKLQAIQGDKRGKDTAALVLEKKEAKVKGSKTELHGSTKIVGDLDAPKLSAGDVEVKGEFKSKFIGDGVTAGPPPKSSLTVDADVTEEERAEYEQYSD